MAASYRGIIKKIIIMLEKTLPSSMRENSFLLRSIFWFATEPKKRLNLWLPATKLPCNLSCWFYPSCYKLGHTREHPVIKCKGFILNSAQVVPEGTSHMRKWPRCPWPVPLPHCLLFLSFQPMVSESSLWSVDCGRIKLGLVLQMFLQSIQALHKG